MVTTKLNLSMTEPQVRQIYAKQGDTGRVLDITLDGNTITVEVLKSV